MKTQQGFVQIIIVGIIAITAVVVGFWGVNNNKEDVQERQREAVPVVDDKAREGGASSNSEALIATSSSPLVPLVASAPTNIVGAHTAFGFNVLKSLASTSGNDNIFISPSSIALALSMVYNGARGATQDAMAKTLVLQGIDLKALNQESLGLMNILKNPDTGVELSVANSVWARAGVSFNKDFLDGVAQYFKAELATLDFKNAQAANTINAWVSKNTKGKIPSIVASPIPSDITMYLINAVYFKGSWTNAFNKDYTRDATFTNGDKTTQQHPFMYRKDEMRYFETSDFQSVALPYGKNERVSMYVFLPKKTLEDFVSKLDKVTWEKWMKSYSPEDGTLLLPTFKLEYKEELTTVLKNLGMSVAFTDAADFGGIAQNLAISEVVHKTYVDVNEEGTEAAAVTGVGAVITSINMNQPKEFHMNVNQPFFVAIRENTTGEILFIGLIQKP